MILQYFVTETATERKIPIEIDRATALTLPVQNPAGKRIGQANLSVTRI